MTITEGFEARCQDCDVEYSSSVRDPTRNRVNSEISNREIWATTHYEKTGHHTFRMARVSERTVSVARIRDPNQLLLSDDPNYSTIHLGPET